MVRQAIKSIQDGDNEGVVEMAVGAGFLTASVTANFYHAEVSSGTFGIERIHLDGNLDVAYAVECEEASCTVAGYKCPVLGLAVTDEGRRRLGAVNINANSEECDICHGRCPECPPRPFLVFKADGSPAPAPDQTTEWKSTCNDQTCGPVCTIKRVKRVNLGFGEFAPDEVTWDSAERINCKDACWAFDLHGSRKTEYTWWGPRSPGLDYYYPGQCVDQAAQQVGDKCIALMRTFGPLQPTDYQWSGACECHPAGSYLTLEDGQSIAIERAAVGTLVKTDTGFQPILGFLHADEDLVGSYLRFTTKSASMAISPGHHTFINGTETDPSFIKLGDLLHTPHGLEPVTRIDTLEARGAYHPMVKGGSYYVDSILASDYDGGVSRSIWPLVRAYVEAATGSGSQSVRS